MNLSLRFSLDSELLFFFILDYISKLGNNECAVVLYYIPLIWKKIVFFPPLWAYDIFSLLYGYARIEENVFSSCSWSKTLG